MDVWKLVNELSLEGVWRIAPLLGPDRADAVGLAIQHYRDNNGDVATQEALAGLLGDDEEAQSILDWAQAFVEEKAEKKKTKKMERMLHRGRTKVGYVNTPILKYFENPDGVKKWQFDRDIRGIGLLHAVVEYLAGGPVREPVAIPILDRTQEGKEDEQDGPAPALPWSEVKKLLGEGFVVCQGKWALNTKSPSWELIKKAFPNAVEAAAYSSGLVSPTVPNGVWLDQEIRFTTITTTNGKSAKTDGSGRAHPSIIARLERGQVTCQVRGISDTGLFVKGILVPDERCVNPETGEPEIWFDWLQVKGLRKPLFEEKDGVKIPVNFAAKKMAAGEDFVTKAHLGIIQVWDKRGEIDWCFELLECIQDTPETRSIISGLVQKGLEKLVEKGVDGLAARVAKDSPAADLALKFISALRSEPHNKKYSPLTIPWLRKAIEEKLGRILWHIGQGAGGTSERYVVCIDDGLAPGTCVLAGRGMRPGTKVAAFRFPVVLSQVLTTLEVVRPLPHMLVDGKIPAYTIYMSPYDITNRMMGDDDGDTVGVSTDPAVLRLFELSIDKNVYLVEPKGEKKFIPTGSHEGNLYMAVDQRGEVGSLTLIRADLLAVGDIVGGNAISILIQEAIDKAKRVIKWTDWRAAVSLANWTETGGGLKFRPGENARYIDGTGQEQQLRAENIEDGKGHVDMKKVRTWKNQRLILHGVPFIEVPMKRWDNSTFVVTKPAFVRGWRRPGFGKRVDPANWHLTAELQTIEGEHSRAAWDGGNLVHHAWDEGSRKWRAIRDQLMLGFDEVDLSTLIHELLWAQGINIPLPTMSWGEYLLGLRKEAGVQKLATDFFSAKNEKEDEVRYAKFDRALDEFWSWIKGEPIGGKKSQREPLTVAEMATVWYMEAKYSRLDNKDNKGNINYGYYTVAWEGSPILALLGIYADESCRFLQTVPPETIRNTLGKITAHETPIAYLMEGLTRWKKHGQVVKDRAGNPIEMWQCPHCTDRLQVLVVRRIRADRSHKEHDFVKSLLSRLNAK